MSRGAPTVGSLNPAQMAWFRAFMATDDVVQAAKVAYPNCRDPRDKGNKLRSHPVISGMIEQARTALATKLGYDRADVLRELTRIADFDPKRLVDENGRPLRMVELDEDTRRGLVDHEFAITSDGTVKLVGAKTNKVEALKILAKALGMLDKQKQAPSNNYIFDIHFHPKEGKAAKGKRGRVIEHANGRGHVVGKDEEE